MSSSVTGRAKHTTSGTGASAKRTSHETTAGTRARMLSILRCKGWSAVCPKPDGSRGSCRANSAPTLHARESVNVRAAYLLRSTEMEARQLRGGGPLPWVIHKVCTAIEMRSRCVTFLSRVRVARSGTSCTADRRPRWLRFARVAPRVSFTTARLHHVWRSADPNPVFLAAFASRRFLFMNSAPKTRSASY